MEAHIRLWRHVIKQALDDLKYPGINKEEAEEWLLIPNKDFNKVCELAHLEPKEVRKAAYKKLNEYTKEAKLYHLNGNVQ